MLAKKIEQLLVIYREKLSQARADAQGKHPDDVTAAVWMAQHDAEEWLARELAKLVLEHGS